MHISARSEYAIKPDDENFDRKKYLNALKKLRFNIKTIAEKNKMPGYDIEYNKEKDLVTFTNRNKVTVVKD